ncbi:adenine phosphoribosyltransferase [Colwellia sp. 4_MG-2023]|jgi:adenine phosphoribosyltransferase|uniref:adenine phosphoribosyltransferase n=1 Tax=unclassified Colwellia TaxID=196834 RepID=UPI001C08C410|nr:MULTISPECIES: adenine phosphoribosyltransferase [unclassified Colwellia]MBU2924458.1 adenine phosphoribosyltransferase [Colwellia sp. C2M11]MDO6489519.1 adenine phosphoribosyltransferase [Colwellia sp. 6_MG-2023]MDO6508193.1 adenine phosphoribosyltransferase [Colwellia sp. 5_MG-2023]MDO6555725.1 adenine phosphoribosyltransferase [Colwellia sp. 4_MG-2023]MDO6653118.1 adenine phosphoribosyltransferase [Colwellia sp. 3_MG-2023]
MTEQQLAQLKSAIKAIPDYPVEGVLFRDVTSLLENAEAFALTIDLLTEKYKDQGFTKVVGTEARGFLFGAPLALALGVGFIPVRKPGKLPRQTFAQAYQLEYGEDVLEIHRDALSVDDKVLIIDDLLATGGTIEATTKLIRRIGAEVKDAGFVISLPDLGGEKRLAAIGLTTSSLVQYAGE